MSLVGKFFGMSAHMKMAMIIAPLLLIGGWGIADYWESRKKASDQVFEMDKIGACNLTKDPCQFRILEFDAQLSALAGQAGGSVIELSTSEPVKAVNLEVVSLNGAEAPRAMSADESNVNRWVLESSAPVSGLTGFNMVISTGEAFLFGDGKW